MHARYLLLRPTRTFPRWQSFPKNVCCCVRDGLCTMRKLPSIVTSFISGCLRRDHSSSQRLSLSSVVLMNDISRTGSSEELGTAGGRDQAGQIFGSGLEGQSQIALQVRRAQLPVGHHLAKLRRGFVCKLKA